MEGVASWLLGGKVSQEKQKSLKIIPREDNLEKLKTNYFAPN